MLSASFLYQLILDELSRLVLVLVLVLVLNLLDCLLLQVLCVVVIVMIVVDNTTTFLGGSSLGRTLDYWRVNHT